MTNSLGVPQGIGQVNRQFEEAFNRGDPAGAAAVDDGGAKALRPGGAIVTARSAIQGCWRGTREAMLSGSLQAGVWTLTAATLTSLALTLIAQGSAASGSTPPLEREAGSRVPASARLGPGPLSEGYALRRARFGTHTPRQDEAPPSFTRPPEPAPAWPPAAVPTRTPEQARLAAE